MELEDIQCVNAVTADTFMQVCLDSTTSFPEKQYRIHKVSGKTCFTILAHSLEKALLILKIVENGNIIRGIINRIFLDT